MIGRYPLLALAAFAAPVSAAEEPRVATLVVVPTPPGVTRAQIEGGFKLAVPVYERIPGLIRKYFTVNGDSFGGMYLWSSRAAANSTASAPAPHVSDRPCRMNARTASARGVPPGSRVRTAEIDIRLRRVRRRFTWVDFPTPSPPSNVMKRAAAGDGASSIKKSWPFLEGRSVAPPPSPGHSRESGNLCLATSPHALQTEIPALAGPTPSLFAR